MAGGISDTQHHMKLLQPDLTALHTTHTEDIEGFSRTAWIPIIASVHNWTRHAALLDHR